MVLEQGAQETGGPERYHERQTESNRLQGERSAGRTKPESSKQNKPEIEESMSASRRDRIREMNGCREEVRISLFISLGSANIL